MGKVDHTILDSDLSWDTEPRVPPERLYSIGAILGISVFASAIAGAVLMMHNARQLRSGRGMIHLLAGIGIAVAVVAIGAYVLPEGAGIVATAIQVGAMYAYVKATQGPQIDIWQAAGGRRASAWLPVGIALGVLALAILSVVLLGNLE